MPPLLIVAIATLGLAMALVVAALADHRRRTSGSVPLAALIESVPELSEATVAYRIGARGVVRPAAVQPAPARWGVAEPARPAVPRPPRPAVTGPPRRAVAAPRPGRAWAPVLPLTNASAVPFATVAQPLAALEPAQRPSFARRSVAPAELAVRLRLVRDTAAVLLVMCLALLAIGSR